MADSVATVGVHRVHATRAATMSRSGTLWRDMRIRMSSSSSSGSSGGGGSENMCNNVFICECLFLVTFLYNLLALFILSKLFLLLRLFVIFCVAVVRVFACAASGVEISF